jgi:N-methylhydantoinase A/oxoprolinase/acetone carboxylase beta subunit
VVTARLTAPAQTEGLGQAPAGAGVDADDAAKAERSVSFTEAEDRVRATIYDGTVAIGDTIAGPAVVEFDHTTLPVPPGASARPDPYGNYLLTSD